MSHAFDAFTQALKAPANLAPPALFRTWNHSDPAVRWAVYRNNVWGSLARVLGESFPVVKALVGEAFFAAMARKYVAARPPTTPVLAQYGGDFADFVGAFEPATGLPYLADVARLEWARIQAYHAADVPALSVPEMAARLARPQALSHAVLGLHPSLSVLMSAHPLVALWAAHQGDQDLADVRLERAENGMVFRAADEPVVQTISHAMAAFIGTMLQGGSLGDAVAAATAQQAQDAEPFDLTQALGVLLQHQLICEWSVHE